MLINNTSLGIRCSSLSFSLRQNIEQKHQISLWKMPPIYISSEHQPFILDTFRLSFSAFWI